MTTKCEAFRSLAEAIEGLLAIGNRFGQNSSEWRNAADELRVRLDEEFATIYPHIPHELEHYLDDSDIRARDADYCSSQENMVRIWVAAWKA
jgi:hypothetical protein